MKIWCQSSGALGKDDSWGPYDLSLRRHIKEMVRPGTQVDLYGTDFTIPGVGRYRSSIPIIQSQAIRNAMRAEEQGYDAFVQLSTNDAGVNEIRELVHIPVVFITESCLHMASLLADKFAFFTHNEIGLQRITELAGRYGMTENMVPGGHLNCFGYAEIMDLFQNPQKHVDTVVRIAKEIGSRGANLLIPSALSFNQWLVDNNLREIDGITILDATAIAVKMAELMVELKSLGINRSPRFYSRPQPEVMEGMRKVYGV